MSDHLTGDGGATREVRVAVIGAGRMAREHLRAFSDFDGVRLVGLYSRTAVRARALADEFAVEAVADSIADLYAGGRPDLVLVTVNTESAHVVLTECIPAAVPILTEKPIAITPEQSREIGELARTHRCRVWVGLNRRCYDATGSVLRELTEIDAPRVIQVFDQQDLGVVAALGHPPEVARNWMYANSIHLVDYLRVFGRGEVDKVTVHHPFDPVRPRLVHASVEFSSGDLGIYTAHWNAPGPWACHVTAAGRRWEMQPLERAGRIELGSRAVRSLADESGARGFKPGFRRQAGEVLRLLAHPDAAGVVPSVDEALRTTELVERLYAGG